MITALVWTLLKIIGIVAPLMLTVAYYTYLERKILACMQDRVGPNRVGWCGLLQPFADGIKLLFKETIFPSKANRYLFILAPVLTIGPALAAWAVIPFSPQLVLANINVGLLYLLTMTSLGVYGIVIAGWASNSKYALLGALRSAAQIISYEIAMGFALVGVLMLSGSMNLSDIVLAQKGGVTSWFWLPLLPLFVIYWISAVAETNRAPFDVAEGESEIVAGFHVEYSGMLFAIFFLAEYANMILLSVVATITFAGGWLSPFEGVPSINSYLFWIPDLFWLISKTGVFMLMFIWFRATFPRYRYDQIMRLGWKIFIPVSMVWVVVVGIAQYYQLYLKNV